MSRGSRCAWLVLLAGACSNGATSAELEDAESATLIVLDASRETPLAGVRVTTPDHRVVETDETGACRLLAGQVNGRIQLHLEKPGYGHGVESVAWAPEMEAYLAPLLELRGRVLAEDTGAPVSGARLTLERVVLCETCALETAVSDRDGHYELIAGGIGLQLGKVSVAAAGFARSTVAPQKSFGVAPREHDFVLRRGLELTGRVVDFETGEGLAGAEVDGFPADESGSFVVRVLPEQGFVELSVRADGYCRLWARIAQAEVERHESFRFPLARGVALEGTVRDAASRPLAGIEVQVWGHALSPDSRNVADFVRPEELRDLPPGWRFELDTRTPWEPPTATTDAAGGFRFEGLPPWSRGLSLLADDGRFRYCESELATVGGPGESTRTELTLGTVHFPEQTDLAIAIRVNGFKADLPGVFSWKGRTREGRVPSRGEFQLSVEGGELALHVALDDFPGPLPGDERVITHLGGYHPYSLDLRVPAKPIAGRVRFEDGPAARVKVRALCSVPGQPSRLLVAEVRTDADGRFHFDAPDLGRPYEVSVLLGEAGRTVEVVPGGEELAFALRRPGMIHLGATDPASGRWLLSHDVTFWWKVSGEAELHRVRPWELQPTDEGLLRVRVPNGELQIEAWPRSEEFRPSRGRRVRVPVEGEPTRVEFALERGIELSLRLDEAGGPLPTTWAWLLLEESARDAVREFHSDNCGPSPPYEFVGTQPFVFRRVSFDPAGAAVVRGLSPGPHCLRAFPSGLWIEPETIQVSETPSGPVVVRWQRTR